MGKRVYIALAVFTVALVGVIFWQVAQLHETEPLYQGKPLSEWLKACSGTDDPEKLDGADEAVRQAGTNALPILLRMLRAKHSALELKLLGWAKRQHVIRIEARPVTEWNQIAAHGFFVLGAKAQSAAPALTEIANRNISCSSQLSAIQALGGIGPSAKIAVSSLLRWSTNADRMVRFHAVETLGKIHVEPSRVVPALRDMLHDPDSFVRSGVVEALGEFGADAKIATPALVEFLNEPQNSMFRRWAIDAIDPAAAAKAGVK